MNREELKTAARRIIKDVIETPIASNRGTRTDWLRPPPVTSFTNLEPMGWGNIDNANWWTFGWGDCTPDLVWPLNVGWIAEHGGDERTLAFTNMRTISMKEARGLASRFSPYMIRRDHAQVVDGKLVTVSFIMAWLGGKWVEAQPMNNDAPVDHSARIAPNIGTGIALRHRYEWAVSLKWPSSPSIRFATDPTGIKELFRLRDIPANKDRRDVLLTWVTDHWRETRSDPDIEAYVRKHLRGNTKFTWNKFECEILPAQFDIEKRDALIAERKLMRAEGTDRRHV